MEDPYENLEMTVGAVVEPGTTLVNRTGGWRSERPVIDQETCIDCGICEKFCPDMSAKEVDGEYVIDYDYCKGCGICWVECPVDAIEAVQEEK